MNILFSAVKLVNTQEIPLDQTQTISISYISESVTIYEADGDALILKEYLSDPNPALQAKIFVSSDAIRIKHGNRDRFTNLLRGYVEVYLPKNYFGVFNVQTISGRIEAGGVLVLSDLNISSTSGSVVLGQVTAGNAVIVTVSGGIHISNLRAIADIRSTSGSIGVGMAEGGGEYKTVSGAIEAAYHAVTRDISAESTSGRIRLLVPSGLSFTMEAHSISGRIDYPANGSFGGNRHSISGTYGDTPVTVISLHTISGRIELIN